MKRMQQVQPRRWCVFRTRTNWILRLSPEESCQVTKTSVSWSLWENMKKWRGVNWCLHLYVKKMRGRNSPRPPPIMTLNGVLVCVYSAVSSKQLVFWILHTHSTILWNLLMLTNPHLFNRWILVSGSGLLQFDTEQICKGVYLCV